MKSFKVKITQCKSGLLWYKTEINTEHEVQNYQDDNFIKTGTNQVIYKVDCEVVC